MSIAEAVQAVEAEMTILASQLKDPTAVAYIMKLGLVSAIGLTAIGLIVRDGTPAMRAELAAQLERAYNEQDGDVWRTLVHSFAHALAREFEAPDLLPATFLATPPVRAKYR